jgi:multiple sugar transport system substrate-binding protein
MCEAELPNINVTETFKPWGDIWTANIAAVAAGSGMPDVIVADRNQLPNESAEGIYQNLGEFAAQDGVDGSQYWPFTWNQSLYEGDPHGIPFETDVRVLFYNKTLFEQAGLDPENPPTTWEEMWEAAEALDVVDGNDLQRIAINPLIGNGPPNLWVLNNDHEWLGEDGTPVVNDPAVVETLEWLQEWIARYGGFENLQRFTQSYSAPPNDHFMGNGVAMIVQTAGYSSILNFYRPRTQLDVGGTTNTDWGVAPLPHSEDGESTSDSGGFTLSIPSGAENPEAAWEFIKCATNTPAQISWARDTYAIPNGPASANAPELMADPNWPMFIEAIESVPADNSTFVAAYPNWQSELANRFESIWTGQVTPEQAMEEAQQAIDAQIESNQ